MKTDKRVKTNLNRNPDHYKDIRKQRVSYPPHKGQFTPETSKNALRKRWEKKKLSKNIEEDEKSED